MNKTLIATAAAILLALIVVAAMVLVLPKEPADDNGNGHAKLMTFNGTEYTWDQLVSEFGIRSVGSKSGVPLGDIMNSTAFADLPGDDRDKTLFRITADDGWTKNVSWIDLQSGILMENNLTTFFPHLPGSFRVMDVAHIDDVPLGPLMVIKAGGTMRENFETTWDELSDNLDSAEIPPIGQSLAGMALVDVFEFAGFADLDDATFTFEGMDGYSKTVNYTEVQDGYLVEDTMRTYFVNLTGEFRVRNLIRITVEY